MKKQFIKNLEQKVCGDRQEAHGNPADTFKRIATLWTAYLKNKGEFDKLDELDVALMMNLFKIARIQGNPKHLDSFEDLAGYAVCAYEITQMERTL